MSKTKAQISMEAHLATLERETHSANNGGVFSNLLANLKAVVEKRQAHYVLDERGEYPVMSPPQHAELTDLYLAVLRNSASCRTAIGGNPERQAQLTTLGAIDQLLAQEFHVLSSMDPKSPGTLDAAEEKMRTRTVEILDHELVLGGANINQRIPVTIVDPDGRKRSGYFTAATTQINESEYQDVIDSMPEKDAAYKKYVELMFERKTGAFQRLVSDIAELNDLRKEKGVSQAYNTIFRNDLRTAGVPDAEIAALTQNTDFTDAVLDCAAKMCPVFDKYDVLKTAGITDTANIAKRNIGMSRVAGLLGVPRLLAQSMPMNVINKGKMIPGTFMESAEGIDIDRASANSPLFQCTPDSIEKNTAFKDLADLQVLDYICGNTDRHLSNFLYKVEAGGPQGPKLTGVMGIDNDCSFGAIKTNMGLMIAPKKMLVMSDGVATILKKIDGDILRTLLADLNFTEEELDAATARLETMQASLDTMKANPNTIKTYKDDEWNAIKTSDLLKRVNAPTNLLGTVTASLTPRRLKREIDAAKQRADEAKQRADEAKQRAEKVGDVADERPQFNTSEELTHFEPLAIFRNRDALNQLMADLEQADPMLVRSSQQFRDMKESLQTLRETNAKMPTVVKDDYVQSLGACYKDLQEKAQAYLDYKGTGNSRLSAKRVGMAQNLSAFATEYADAFDNRQRENEKKAAQKAYKTEEKTKSLLEELKADNASYLAHTKAFQYDSSLAPFGKQAHDSYEVLAMAAALESFTPQQEDLVRHSVAKVLAFETFLVDQTAAFKELRYGGIATAMKAHGDQGLNKLADKLMKTNIFEKVTPYITPDVIKELVTGQGIGELHKKFNTLVQQMERGKQLDLGNAEKEETLSVESEYHAESQPAQKQAGLGR